MWPEFVRKLTILLLYDRLNSKTFRPRYWKPGNWFLSMTNEQKEAEKKMEEERGTRSNNSRRSSRVNSGGKKCLFGLSDEPKTENKDDKNSLLEIKTLMASNLDLNSFKPYEVSDFGSFNYMIRSRNNDGPQTVDDQSESFLKFKPNKLNLKPLNKTNANEGAVGNVSVQFDQMMKKNNQQKKLAPLDKNNPDKQSIENLFSTGSNLKLGNLKGNSYLQLNDGADQFDQNLATNRTTNDFEYSKVTDDIYKTFGRTRQDKYNYPQQIHVIKTSRGKPVPDPLMKGQEEYTINDLIENSNYSKSVLGTSKGDYIGQITNRDKTAAGAMLNPGTTNQLASANKWGASSRLVPLESSRLDSRSINGGANSNMSSATNFSNNRNNKLLKILGDF